MDRRVGDTLHLIAPPYHGGVVVSFDVARIVRITGQVSIRRGDVIDVPAYGTLTIATRDGRSFTSPLSVTGAFYFEDLPAGTYTAQIDWTTGTCAFPVTVPPARTAETNLGSLVCTAASR
jgi:hypothetical protein